ncbi:MAG TPA: response regulator [Azospirillaceae bacterium]|nr:response regulator [Azospirillaceae bacterium]
MTARPSSGKYYRFDSISVLVADDNRFVRQILVTVLKGLGVGKVLQAESGEEAQAIIDIQAQMGIDGKAVDMVFADHLMRPGDGLDLLQWCRAHERDSVRFVPFVMMSGEADVKAVIDARDYGVTEYLAKPMSVTGVASRLLGIIDRPRPFVRTSDYFGPDRRRQSLPVNGGDRRMMATDDIRVFDETVMDDDDVPPPGTALEEAADGR